MDDEFIFAGEESDVAPCSSRAWNILVVDDDVDVHQATRLSLENVRIHGRTISLIDVHSGHEAIATLKNNQQIDLILLDMIMESKDSGLDVANWLRNESGCYDKPIIILRTGQAGVFRDAEIQQNKNFNAIVEKSSLTRESFITLLTTMLRNAAT
jgi:CheY-like chemotaxis protein